MQSLADYFQNSDKRTTLGKVFYAHRLEQGIQDQFQLPVKVVFRASRLAILTEDHLTAAHLASQISKLRSLAIKILGPSAKTKKIIVRSQISLT